MTIGADDRIEKFEDTTPTEVTSSQADLTDGSFSAGLAWTNTDDSDKAVVILAAHFNTAPTANGPVHIHLRALNIAETTGDEPVPSADWSGGYVGTILVDDITTDHWPSIRVALRNAKAGQEYEWYVENQAGQTLGDSTGSDHWRLFVMSVTDGPHA